MYKRQGVMALAATRLIPMRKNKGKSIGACLHNHTSYIPVSYTHLDVYKRQEQWAAEFLHLYPNAKLLVTSKKDFEPGNRKKFCARIATGDYDAVIIGHSQFEKIPITFTAATVVQGSP